MVQLGKFQCNEGGSTVFGEDGMPTGEAGNLRVVDDAEFLIFSNDEDAYGKVYELGYVTTPLNHCRAY